MAKILAIFRAIEQSKIDRIENRPHSNLESRFSILCHFSLCEKWRTRLQPIRTASEITAKIIIQPLERIPLYQKIAQKVAELRLLGMPHKKIAESLGISERTSKKALRFQKTRATHFA